MKDVSVGNKNNKFGLKSKLLLGALALAVIVGLATTAQAAQKDTDKEANAFLLLYRQARLFNPFTLDSSVLSATTNVTRSSSSTGILGRPSAAGISSAPTGEGEGGHSRRRLAIRIPFRPALRSPWRPPIIP